MTAHILLIDFEQRSLQATRTLLEGAGFQVQTARTGREAEQFLRDSHLDLVVLEPMIPGQDGFKLIANIKKRGNSGHVPRVVVASRIYRGPKYRAMSRDAGADSYLERPQQDDLLLPTIERLLPNWRPAAAPADGVVEYVSAAHAIPVPPTSASLAGAPATASRVAALAPEPAQALVVEAASADARRPRIAVAPMPEDENELTGVTEFDIEDALSRVLGSDLSQPTGEGSTAAQSAIAAADEVATTVRGDLDAPPPTGAELLPPETDYDSDVFGLDSPRPDETVVREAAFEEELESLSTRIDQPESPVAAEPVLGPDWADGLIEPDSAPGGNAGVEGALGRPEEASPGDAADEVLDDLIVARLDGFGADPELAADTPIGRSSGEEDFSSPAAIPAGQAVASDSASVKELLEDLVCPDDLTLEQAFAMTDAPDSGAKPAAGRTAPERPSVAAPPGAERSHWISEIEPAPPVTADSPGIDARDAGAEKLSSAEELLTLEAELDRALSPPGSTEFGGLADALQALDPGTPHAAQPAPPAVAESDAELPGEFAAALDRLELTSEVLPSAEMPAAPVIFDAEAEDLDAFTAGLVSKEEAESAEFEELPELIPEAGLSLGRSLEAGMQGGKPEPPAGAPSAEPPAAPARLGAAARPSAEPPASAAAGAAGQASSGAATRQEELDLEAELERAFSGFHSGEADDGQTGAAARGGSDLAGEARRPRGEGAPKAVPEHLKGMDAGTADLLRSLEELENSMPPDIPPAADQGWAGSAGFNDPTCDIASSLIPLGPQGAGAAANAQKLDEVISHIQAAAPKPDDSTGISNSEGLVVEPLAGPLYGEAPGAVAKQRRRADEFADEPFRNLAATGSPASGRRTWTGLFLVVLAIGILAAGILSWVFLFKDNSSVNAQPPANEDRSAEERVIPPPAIEAPSPRMSADAGANRARPASEQSGEHGAKNEADRARRAPAEPRPEGSAATDAPSRRPADSGAAEARPATVPLPAPASATIADEGRPSPEPAMETGSPSLDRPAPIQTNQVESRPPAPAELVRLAELDSPLQLVTSPPPDPTPEAQEAGVGGRVILSVLVGEDGAVAEARVIVEPGYGLGQAAIDAVRSWRYTPPLRGSQPVRVWKTEEITFKASAESSAGTP